MQKGDIVTCVFMRGNQKNLTLNKDYEILNVNHNEYRSAILLQMDNGVKRWFNDRNTTANFMPKVEEKAGIVLSHPMPKYSRSLVIVRMPFSEIEDDQEAEINSLVKCLEFYKSEFAFIIIQDETVETIQFEYPLNHNLTTPLDFLSDSTKIKSL